MNKIPTHKIAEKFQGEIAFLKRFSVLEPTTNNHVNYAHRDDYYIFLFIERGDFTCLIDFEEHSLKENSVLYILPGQVHLFNEINFPVSGWVLMVDGVLVKDEYKEIFEKTSLVKSKIELNEEIKNDLTLCASILERRLNTEKQPLEQSIANLLISAYIGIIAEAYQQGLPAERNNRYSAITMGFKKLLSNSYKTLKNSSQYASEMNLSPVYLNEAVKNTTGMNVTQCIQQEIIVQAQRLLYYTQLTVKEIAWELGYEDTAYFTRLFTKVCLFTPTEFRKKYLK